nr:NosD domain-containing protein [Candidatus Freyarchaeota archaeon]
MSSHQKILIKRKKLILSLIIIASLTGLLTFTLLTSQQTPPFLPTATQPAGIQATQTPKLPTIQNLTSESLIANPSALENSVEVTAISQFNETFFGLSIPSNVTNIISFLVLLEHTASQGLNSSAPHNIFYMIPPGGAGPAFWCIPSPYYYSSLNLNETTGYIIIGISGTDSSAAQNCAYAAKLIFNELQSKLYTTWGITIQKIFFTTVVLSQIQPSEGLIEFTGGLLYFNSLNTSAEIYNFMEGLIPDNTFAKTIAQKDSSQKTISIMDSVYNQTGTFTVMGRTQVGAVIEEQIGESGGHYTFSLRKLLDTPTGSNIKSQTPNANIQILLPVTSNITAFYPTPPQVYVSSYVNMQPEISCFSGMDIGVEDLNVTYTLESGLPYVIVDYDMSNLNMNPGETGTLTLTLKNVGTVTAHNVTPSTYIINATVMYFTDGLPPPDIGASFAPSTGPYDIAPGESVVIDYNITAKNTGSTTIYIPCEFRLHPSGLTNYMFYSGFYAHVGVSEPLLVYSTECSNWVASPGDTVSVYFTVRNVGEQTANNVNITFLPTLGPVIDSNVTLPEMGQPWVIAETLTAGQAITANVTSEVDYPTFHTGGTPTQYGQNYPYQITLPLTLPGIRPPTAAHLQFEKHPEQVSFGINDTISVSVRVKNLGLETETVTIMDIIPSEYFELYQGTNNITIDVASGSSATLTYTLKAIKAGTLKLPSSLILVNHSIAYSARNIIGAPLPSNDPPTVDNILVESSYAAKFWFSCQVSDLNGDPITAYEWDFGDGTSSTDPTPHHEYADEGTYTISLRVQDSNGAWSQCRYLTIITTVWTNPTINDVNVFTNLNITLNGNLNITETGELHLTNCTLNLNNGTSPIQYGISVHGGLYINESTKITAINPANPYYFTVYEGATFQVNNSWVEYCGHESGSWPDKQGLTVRADNVWIENTTITYCYHGLILYNSQGSTILNNIAENNQFGFYLENSSNNILSGNTANNNGVQGFNTGGFFLSSSSNNTLSGNTANNNYDYGFLYSSSSNNTITGNTATENYYGFCLYASSNNTVTGNTAANNIGYGFTLSDSSDNNIVSGNTVVYNKYYLLTGLVLSDSGNNSLSGNVMIGSGLSVRGSLEILASNAVDQSNTVNGKVLYYYVSRGGLSSADFTNAGQVILVNCSDSEISDLSISLVYAGIQLSYSCNNTISRNDISSSYYGIYLSYSCNNTISRNDISFNFFGIYLSNSNNNTLSGNTANNNHHSGFRLDNSHYNNLTGNSAAYNYNFWGFYISSSSYNNLSGNTANNNYVGFFLAYSSNNTLSDNNATNNNANGFYLSISSDNVLTGNTATNKKRVGVGFFLEYSSSNILTGNTAENYIYGFFLRTKSNNNNLPGNIAINCSTGYTWSHESVNNNFTGSIEINYLRVKITDASGLPISGAHVKVENDIVVYATSYFGGSDPTTDSNGLTPWIAVPYRTFTGPLTMTENTTLITANYYGLVFKDNPRTIIMSTSHVETFQFLKYMEVTWINPVISDVNISKYFNITINGDLTITGTGELHLINCTLSLNNGNTPVQYGISVYGAIYINESSTITAINPANPYYFTVHKGSTFQMNDSRVEYCGHESGSWPDKQGLTVGADNAWIENNTITHGYYGLILYMSERSIILNNTATENEYGFYLYYGCYNTLLCNTATNNGHHGFKMVENTYFNFTGNTATNNGYAGFYLELRNSYNTLWGNNATDNYYGFWLESSSNNNLTGNTATNNDVYGFYLKYGFYNTLWGNNATDNYYGFWLESSSNNNLTGNTAKNNDVYGFYLSSSLNNNLSGNTAKNYYGFYLVSSSYNTLWSNNATDNGREGFYLYSNSNNNNLSDNIATNNYRYGFFLENCSYNNLVNNTAEGNRGGGFRLQFSPYNILSGNNAMFNSYPGFRLYRSSYNNLSGNTAIRNSYLGFSLEYCSYTNLINNTATNIIGWGFYLVGCSYNNLINNTATNNVEYGFHLDESSYNNLWGNNATNNNWDGFYLESSWKNTLSFNTAVNNTQCGFRLDYGWPIYWLGYISHWEGNNTFIYNMATNNDESGFYLYFSYYNDFSGNTASNNNQHGFYISTLSDSNDFSGNTASNNNQYGFYQDVNYHYTVFDNTAINNSIGFYLCGNYFVISGNTAANNHYHGFYLDGVSLSIENNNAINNNYDGFQLYYCTQCTFTGNNAINNSRYGFYLYKSHRNSLSGNSATNNIQCGFRIDYGDITFPYITWEGLNTIHNNNVKNSNYGFYIYDSSYNTLTLNFALNCTMGYYCYDTESRPLDTIENNFKGSEWWNYLRVNVTDINGYPIPGASVVVLYINPGDGRTGRSYITDQNGLTDWIETPYWIFLSDPPHWENSLPSEFTTSVDVYYQGYPIEDKYRKVIMSTTHVETFCVIDNADPWVVITAPTSDSTVNTGVVWINGTFDGTGSNIIDINVNDTTRFERVEPSGAGPYSITGIYAFRNITAISTGEFGVEIVVQDGTGRTGTATRRVILDQNNPIVTITIPPSDGTFYTGGVWINGTFDETGSQVAIIAINDSRFALVEPVGAGPYGISGTYCFVALITEEGEFGLEVTVWDQAGLTGTATRHLILLNNTPTGEDVEVTDPVSGISVTFDNVTDSGTTIVITNATGPEPPAGFEVSGVYHNITTTSNYTGSITIAIPYDESQISVPEEYLKLMHWDEELEVWVDVTTWVDVNNNIVYGEVTSFSVFVVMEPIDVTPPTTSIDLSGVIGLNSWYLSNVTVTLTATDDIMGVAKIEYRLEGTPWTTYIVPFAITDEGITTVYYRSFDLVGNEEEAKSMTIRIDETPPTTELVIGTHYVDEAGNIYVTSDTMFTITATDAFSGVAYSYYRINGGDWIEYVEPFTITGPIGTYTIEYYSVDGAGNKETPKSKTVILEQTFQGYGMLRIDKQWFRGDATLFLSEHLIRIQVGDQIATWNIVKHYKLCNIEIYFGEGELGKIVLIIHRGQATSHVLAVGSWAFFCGRA